MLIWLHLTVPRLLCIHWNSLKHSRDVPISFVVKSGNFTHLDSSWNLVHVLGFDDGFQVVFQQFGEIVLQFRATKVSQDFSPVWRVLFRNHTAECSFCTRWCSRKKQHRQSTTITSVQLDRAQVLFTYRKFAQIWLLLSCQDFQGCWFSNSVGADQTEHLSGTRVWQPERQMPNIHEYGVNHFRVQFSVQVKFNVTSFSGK